MNIAVCTGVPLSSGLRGGKVRGPISLAVSAGAGCCGGCEGVVMQKKKPAGLGKNGSQVSARPLPEVAGKVHKPAGLKMRPAWLQVDRLCGWQLVWRPSQH
jgi:hypothetical protein